VYVVETNHINPDIMCAISFQDENVSDQFEPKKFEEKMNNVNKEVHNFIDLSGIQH
jgi:hypothetical protein